MAEEKKNKQDQALGAQAQAGARTDPELAKKTAAAVPDTVAAAGEPQARKSDKNLKKKRRQKKLIKWGVIIVIVLIVLGVFFRMQAAKKAAQATEVDAKNIGTVQRGEVVNELTSSGSLEAKDKYTITSLVEGEIIEADFEEGDQVEKGQVLYRIDPSDINREISSAEKSLSYAEDDLSDAKEEYQRALKDLNGGTWVAPSAGYIKNLSLEAGDRVSQNTEIAELYNDSSMKLRVPFLNTEADAIAVGAQVVVTLSDTGEQIPGQVIEKSSLEETLSGGTMVKYITVVVTNPGGISTSDSATVQCGDLYSAGSGNFEAYTSTKLKYDLSQGVKVAAVLVHEGDYVNAGTPIFKMTSESYDDAIKSYKNALEQAEQTLDSANDKLEQQQENLEDYTITAPISGQVISKTGKVGDKISRSSNSDSSTLAIIYDMSELSFEMSIDELDISKVEVGQEVEITADAFEDETYTGHVTNVSLNGTYSNGVTTYPVTVTLDEMGDLIPSMNVDGTIILDKVEDTLYIPTNALQRGNIVYVRDTSLTEEQKAAAENGTEDGTDAKSGNRTGAAASESQAGGSEGAPERSPEQAAEGTGGAAAQSAAHMPRQNDIPSGFTAVRVETGLVTDDYVEINSGLSEGQEVYVKESAGSGGFMGFMGGGMGGPGGGPGGGGPGGGRP